MVTKTAHFSADASDSGVFAPLVHLDGYPLPACHDVQVSFGAFPAKSAHAITAKRDVRLVLD